MGRSTWTAGAFAVSLCFLSTAAAACPARGQETATVVRVEPRLELRLADGRLIRLTGLDPAQPTPADPLLPETAQARLTALLAGRPITLTLAATARDRWGRLPAEAFAMGAASQPENLAAAAIAAGLGRYLAEPLAHACRDALIAAEKAARAAKLGLWRDPYYAVLAVDDHAGFTERSATLVLAEGQLTAVEPSPYRTSLRFADPGDGADRSRRQMLLIATIPPRLRKAFDAQGVHLPALIGRKLRVRGLLDLRFGPRIELAGPDAIETDGPDAPGASTQAASPAGPQ